jgi:transposase
MPAKKYIVDFTAEEREYLFVLIRRGKTSARKLTRARILLKADEGLNDEEIAEAVGVSVPTVERTRRRFVAENLKALTERPRPGQRPRLSAKAEAQLIAVACSAAPAGRQHWTLRLLADKAVELGLAPSLSPETVRRVLKKTSSSRGRRSGGASPP